MAEEAFRTLRSQWLDKNDEQPSDDLASSDKDDTKNNEQSKWETIMGMSTCDSHRQRPRPSQKVIYDISNSDSEDAKEGKEQYRWDTDMETTPSEAAPDRLQSVQLFADDDDTLSDISETRNRRTRNQEKGEGECSSSASSKGCSAGLHLFGSSKSPSRRQVWFQMGCKRFLPNSTLLVIRIISLCVLWTSAALPFFFRNASLFSLLPEMFPWLHFFFIVFYPLVVMSSFKILCDPPLYESQNIEDAKPLWACIGIVSHIIVTFSFIELIRLLILHDVPSFRPNFSTDSAVIYSLWSMYALQRYAMAVVAALELTFSRIPHRLYNIPLILFTSTCWEASMSHFRFVEKTSRERVALVLGPVALAVSISALCIGINHMLSKLTSKLSERRKVDQSGDSLC